MFSPEFKASLFKIGSILWFHESVNTDKNKRINEQ